MEFNVEKKVAKHLVVSSLKSATAIGDLLPFAKEFTSDNEYDVLKIAIAQSVYAIHENIHKAIYKLHPELEAEIEADVKKYGRAL